LGSTFWQIKYDTATGMVSRTGLVYIAVVMVAITNANNVIPQIPYLCFSTLLFCAICFTMCGVAINSGREFFEFWVIFLEYAACITYFGIFLAMLTPTPQVHSIHSYTSFSSYFFALNVVLCQLVPKDNLWQ
jgi:ABC-type multidrug transport system permease subunit